MGDDLHDFYFVIHLPKRQIFKSEKKLRELHINYSDGVELGYTTEYGDVWQRKPELGEVMP